jgi:hypothetical protein
MITQKQLKKIELTLTSLEDEWTSQFRDNIKLYQEDQDLSGEPLAVQAISMQILSINLFKITKAVVTGLIDDDTSSS